MKIGILGAGNVALANAAWLASKGHDIHLWTALDGERQALADGTLSIEGLINAKAKITIASDVSTVIADADLVMIAAPAFAHDTLMSAASPYLTNDHVVMVHPVTGLSSLLLSRMTAKRNVAPLIIDASTSLFTARKAGPATVRILKIKDVIDIAAIPARRGVEAMMRMSAIYGDRFRLEPNALAVSLNNHNPVYHVPPLLCNLSRAERQESWMIWECITPGVAKLVKLADDERLLVVRHYGTTEISVADYFRQAHGAEGDDLPAIFASVAKKLKGPTGPQAFDHRFITEDVPYALVFFDALAQAAGIEMPITRNLIELTSALYERDFVAEGHTLERLGLSGLSASEIIDKTMNGFAA